MLETVTVALAVVVAPPGLPHVSVYVFVVAVRGPVLWVPILGSGPLQAPEAVHEAELGELQVSVATPLGATTVGEAVKVVALTVTVVVAAALVPPGPAHVNEKVVVFVNAPLLLLPLAASEPLQPPEAVHEVAFVELHVRVDVPFCETAGGEAANVAVGTMLTATLAGRLVPPAPVQVRENVVAAVSDPVLLLPLVASEPLQPPEAVHELAFVELHVSVVEPPLLTAVLAAVSDTVGTGLDEPPPHATSRRVAPIGKSRIGDRIVPDCCVDCEALAPSGTIYIIVPGGSLTIDQHGSGKIAAAFANLGSEQAMCLHLEPGCLHRRTRLYVFRRSRGICLHPQTTHWPKPLRRMFLKVFETARAPQRQLTQIRNLL